jgi:hypothetical protein
MGSFALITEGPANPSGQTLQATPNGLLLDKQNNILSTVGLAGTESVPSQRLYTVGPQAAITAITTAQNLWSQALNSYALNRQFRCLRIRGEVMYNTTSTNVATITIALTLGGVTLCSIGTTATNTAASTNLPLNFEFIALVAVVQGNVGVFVSSGSLDAELGTAVTTAIARFLDGNINTQNTITIGTNPASGSTITINGTVVTWIPNGNTPSGNQVALGTTATLSATALYTFLAASADANISKATYTNPSNGVVLAVSKGSGAVPWAVASVPADYTFTIPTVNLEQSVALALAMSTGVAAIPSAQLAFATVDVEGA